MHIYILHISPLTTAFNRLILVPGLSVVADAPFSLFLCVLGLPHHIQRDIWIQATSALKGTSEGGHLTSC